MEENRDGRDCTDKPPSSCQVTKTNLASFAFSIILHCVDVAFDLYVAYSYFESSKYSYGAWSVAFILVPSIALATISVRMYLEDLHKKRIKFSSALSRVILCIFGLPIQSAPLIRTVDSLYFASKSLKAEKQSDLSIERSRKLKEKYFIKMLEEDSDASFLKVFEAYLESAPQQVLQMTFLLVETSKGLYVHSLRQILSILAGFCSMSYSMASYYRSIRLDQENKENVSLSGLIMYFLWHLLFTVSRILSVSAVASLYPFWTCVGIGLHWFITSIWLALLKTYHFCPTKFLDVLFACTVGAIYIFNFFSLKDKKKKYYYLVFYSIIFVENTVASVIWALESSFKNWVYYFFTILPSVCFILGSIFMILYYKCFHPALTKPKTSAESNSEEKILVLPGKHHAGGPPRHQKI